MDKSPPHNASYFRWGIIILVLANIGFSAKAIIIKLMYRYEVDTISVIALRMILSVPIFIIVAIVLARRKDNVPLTFKEWLSISGLGILSYYVSSMLDFLGLQYVTASVERLILFTYPTIVLILSLFLFKRKIKGNQIAALILTYAGIVLVFIAEKGIGAQKNLWLGGALILGCAFTYALYVVLTGELVHRFGSVKFTAYAMIAATVPALVQSYFYNGMAIFNYPKQVYLLSIWMALAATVIPVFLIVEGIRLVGARLSSIIGFIGPVATIVMGAVFLDERVSSIQLLGTAVVLTGIFLITYKGRG